MKLFKVLLLLATLGSAFGQGSPMLQFKTVADLIAYSVPSINTRLTAFVTGRLSTNDGAGGTFFYESTSATTTNRGTIFKPS